MMMQKAMLDKVGENAYFAKKKQNTMNAMCFMVISFFVSANVCHLVIKVRDMTQNYLTSQLLEYSAQFNTL